jgi:hypothetical protein
VIPLLLLVSFLICWLEMLQDLPVKPKNLLALAVGIKQNASVNAIIQKVSQSQFPK